MTWRRAAGRGNHRRRRVGGIACRRLITPGDEEDPTLCGNAEQQTEFDRRAALINAGVICGAASAFDQALRRRTCMTAEQWEAHDRYVRNYADAARMGSQTASAVARSTGSTAMAMVPRN
jgi:hypothetical protein